jgi:hypothetical protein
MRWRALALGDTCLFLVKAANTPTPYLQPLMPITNSTQFNRTPPLVSSKIDEEVGHLLTQIKYGQESYEHGDILLLATDALARWLCYQAEQGLFEWQTLLTIATSDDFAHFILQWRGSKANQIEKDDTSLVVIPL